MINTIVFTKDRACQMDAFLRSLKHHWVSWKEETTISVIWTYKDDNFLAGYEKLFQDHPEINWVSQKDKDFKTVLLDVVQGSTKPYFTSFVDDIIFINPFTIDCPEFNSFSSESHTTCLSLRMHPKISYCYMLNIDLKAPEFVEPGKWVWFNLPGDFGYPFSLDGHIFHARDIIPCLTDETYNGPNSLEDKMTYRMPKKTYARCFQEPKIVNIPVNSVGSNIYNRRGNVSEVYLNEKYLNGHRIDIMPYSGLVTTGCHMELAYTWL